MVCQICTQRVTRHVHGTRESLSDSRARARYGRPQRWEDRRRDHSLPWQVPLVEQDGVGHRLVDVFVWIAKRPDHAGHHGAKA